MGVIATNKKARFDYEILETFEAGISLLGAEVKAIRASRVQLKDSFIKIVKNEAFMFNAHISLFSTTNAFFAPKKNRSPKLLLHRRQIDYLNGCASQKGFVIVPLSIYLLRGKIKLEIALARGKKLYDKREDLKKKALDLEAKASLKNYVCGL
ncbi:MAG: SsrA-binding protein SmpB [Helicobacter sp.]|nr:SsrA-binding protein SmpB [Helicobacter sp.]